MTNHALQRTSSLITQTLAMQNEADHLLGTMEIRSTQRGWVAFARDAELQHLLSVDPSRPTAFVAVDVRIAIALAASYMP